MHNLRIILRSPILATVTLSIWIVLALSYKGEGQSDSLNTPCQKVLTLGLVKYVKLIAKTQHGQTTLADLDAECQYYASCKATDNNTRALRLSPNSLTRLRTIRSAIADRENEVYNSGAVAEGGTRWGHMAVEEDAYREDFLSSLISLLKPGYSETDAVMKKLCLGVLDESLVASSGHDKKLSHSKASHRLRRIANLLPPEAILRIAKREKSMPHDGYLTD